MLTRKDLAKRWKTTARTIDRRRAMGLLPWVDLARGTGNRPQIRFLIEDIEDFEHLARLCPEAGAVRGRKAGGGGGTDVLNDQTCDQS